MLASETAARAPQRIFDDETKRDPFLCKWVVPLAANVPTDHALARQGIPWLFEDHPDKERGEIAGEPNQSFAPIDVAQLQCQSLWATRMEGAETTAVVRATFTHRRDRQPAATESQPTRPPEFSGYLLYARAAEAAPET